MDATKTARTARWARRKARRDGNHGKTGFVGGNVRYSGKGGTGGWVDRRPDRNRNGMVS